MFLVPTDILASKISGALLQRCLIPYVGLVTNVELMYSTFYFSGDPGVSTAESALLTGTELSSVVQNIVDMGYSKEQVNM